MLAQSSAMESCWYSRFLYWDKTGAATQHVGAQAAGRFLPAHLLRSSYPRVFDSIDHIPYCPTGCHLMSDAYYVIHNEVAVSFVCQTTLLCFSHY